MDGDRPPHRPVTITIVGERSRRACADSLAALCPIPVVTTVTWLVPILPWRRFFEARLRLRRSVIDSTGLLSIRDAANTVIRLIQGSVKPDIILGPPRQRKRQRIIRPRLSGTVRPPVIFGLL